MKYKKRYALIVFLLSGASALAMDQGFESDQSTDFFDKVFENLSPREDLSDEIFLEQEESLQLKRSRDESSSELEEERVAKQSKAISSCESNELDIHSAAKNGDNEQLSLLLNADKSLVNKADKDGLTPIYFAAINGHEAAVNLLLAHGANATLPNTGTLDDLHLHVFLANTVANKGYDAIADVLFKEYAKPESHDGYNYYDKGYFVLKALWDGLDKAIEYHLKRGWNVNNGIDIELDDVESTLIMLAGNLKEAFLFLNWGADIHKVSVDGYSAYSFAKAENKLDLVKLFDQFSSALKDFLDYPYAFEKVAIQGGFKLDKDFLVQHIYYGLPHAKNVEYMRLLGKKYISHQLFGKQSFDALFDRLYSSDTNVVRKNAYKAIQAELSNVQYSALMCHMLNKQTDKDIGFKFR